MDRRYIVWLIRKSLGNSVASKTVVNFHRALDERKALLIEDQVALYDGSHLLFRSVLLPLSDDQQTINYLLGAANGKIAHD